jgi:hypothetical protein
MVLGLSSLWFIGLYHYGSGVSSWFRGSFLEKTQKNYAIKSKFKPIRINWRPDFLMKPEVSENYFKFK